MYNVQYTLLNARSLYARLICFASVLMAGTRRQNRPIGTNQASVAVD